MPEFKKNNRFTNGPRRPFQNRDSRQGGFGQKELYDAECNSCHNRCQVPFRPNGKKPVYCSDCFKRDDDRPQQGRFEKREFAPSRDSASAAPSFVKDPRIDELKRQLTAMNDTLERLVLAIETSNRSNALSKEVRKHVVAAKPASAPAKKVPAKAAAKPAAKSPAKKPAKKKG